MAELDPEFQRLQDISDENVTEDPEADTPENPVPEKEPDIGKELNKWSYKIPVLGKIKYAGDAAALGVGDFAADAIGLVPWLKPYDSWWDNNSPRSQNPSHKIIRDASSVIIPSMVGGGAVVGSARAATQAMGIPKYAQTLGSIAAWAGVDTAVAAISSHSKTDDNLAGTLNQWLGWNIPWATRTGDDPDTRWKKNVMESAGLSAGVELLGATFSFAKKAKLFPRDIGAEEAITARKQSLKFSFDDPATEAVETRRVARKAAQNEEMVDALKADPSGEDGYNAFINDLGDDAAGRAVVELEADPLMAKLHQTQIQNNIGTYNGRSVPVVDNTFTKRFRKAVNGNERAQQLDALFDSITPNFDAIVSRGGGKPVKITAEQMNRSVDNLTQAIYGKNISFKEFEFIVDDMKKTVFNSNEILDEESWIIASRAFKNVFDKMFDPNQMRASGMLLQQTADTITDTATAAKMLGESADTTRQTKIIFDKMDLLAQEVKTNQYILNKSKEYQNVIASGDIDTTVKWLTKTSDDFETFLAQSKSNTNSITNELQRIAKEQPNFYRPFIEAYDATNGDIDTLHKLHTYAEHHIGFLKKAFVDGQPEIPSMIVKGLHGVRINSLLSGLSALRAGVGNSTLTAIKPISAFAGAMMQGDTDVFKRSMYVYGGITENLKRGFKVLSSEWKLANMHPEEAAMRGRADMRVAKMEKLEFMDSMAKGWEEEGEYGKVAMWNIARGMTWWNKQKFVRYGTNALYAIDGMTNSFMASGMARARAYDEVLERSKGGFDEIAFQKMQKELYSQAFDDKGLLTDKAAKFASQEIALNLDSNVVQGFEKFMDHVPAARSLFLFPRTGLNATELAWSFNPASNLGPALTKARRVFAAKTQQAKIAALLEHGIDSTQNPELAFRSLKSEYIGRQIMGSTIVMGLGMWAIEGNMTGNGPQDDAERRRMMAMGWQPNSLKNPITGEWHSYRNFEPFASLMGLTADAVYQSNRVDQSVTEDWFRKIGHSISMNITSDTFIQGFEPLAGLVSGDPGAWNRFTATQIDMTIPYKGVRSVLNKAITPQLKDVENDIGSYLLNMNKFLAQKGTYEDRLKDQLDIYTGNPIRYHETLTAAVNSVLPVANLNGGMEPWRQWLLATGWDGLQRIRRNKITKMPLSTFDRQFMNNWIAKNAGLKSQIINLMNEDNGYWNKQLKEYVKERGLKRQEDYPIKETLLYKELDRIHDRAFEGAWDALEAFNYNLTPIGREKHYRNVELQQGKFKEASRTQRRVQELQNKVRR